MRPAWPTVTRTALAVMIGLAGCGPAGGGADRTAAAADGGAAPGTPRGLPLHAPDRFGFGSEASAARVALWDIDVRPDGAGLPSGSGTVEQGRDVYMVHCVACHGPTGVEGPNDRLVATEQWDDAPGTRAIGNYGRTPRRCSISPARRCPS